MPRECASWLRRARPEFTVLSGDDLTAREAIGVGARA